MNSYEHAGGDDLFLAFRWTGAFTGIPPRAALATASNRDALDKWLTANTWMPAHNAMAAIITKEEARRVIRILATPDFEACRSEARKEIWLQCSLTVVADGRESYYYPGDDAQAIARLMKIRDALDEPAAATITPIIKRVARYNHSVQE